MNSRIFLLLLLFATNWAAAQSTPPQLENVAVVDNGGNQISISYDLSDVENDDVEISLRISADGGQTFLLAPASATGDIGFPVSPGTGKSISWNYSGQINSSDSYVFRLIANDRQTIAIDALVSQVDSNRLRADLEFVAQIRHRNTGAAHLEAVIDTIYQRFSEAGLQTEFHTFDYDSNYEGRNIIGTSHGLTNQATAYYLGGHFDTVENSPGADDNGSAVVGFLEAMRILAPYQFSNTIRFIGFDLEEEGLVGSLAYAGGDFSGIPDYETVGGFLDLEMIGYYSNVPNTQELPFGFDLLFPQAYAEVANDDFRGNFLTNVGQSSFSAFRQSFDNAAATYVPELRVVSLDAPQGWLTLTPDLGRSDHASFWINSLPAVMLTDGANFRNEHYHTAGDTIGNLNFTFMTDVVKACVATLAELGGLQNSTYVDVSATLTSTNELDLCQFKLGANPAQEYLLLTWENCSQKPLQLKLFNIQGQILHQANLKMQDQAMQMNTASFPTGTYFLEISNGQARWVEKVIVE